MVVRGGFRDRWSSQSANRNRPLESDSQEFFELPEDFDFGFGDTDIPLDVSEMVEHDNDCTLGPHDVSAETGDASALEFPDAVEPGPSDLASLHLQPTARSRPRPPVCSKEFRASVKRTTDEFMSSQVHKQISDLKQPWQRGPLSSLFSKPKKFWESASYLSSASLVGLSEHLAAVDSDAAIPRQLHQSESTVARIRSSRIVSTDDDFRRLALSRYKTMVLIDLSVTRLGLSLMSFAGALCTDDELIQIFNDVFAPKASGTVLKRCNAMWRFSCWLQTGSHGSPFNQNVATVYRYICHLRETGAGSTTPSQFVEALRFSDALLGFCNTRLSDMLSPRVTGATHAAYMTKRARKPAEVLKVSETRELEQICIHDDDLHRRVIAGHILFSFMAAARDISLQSNDEPFIWNEKEKFL